MCQPAFFSPFLLHSLRLASSEPPARPALKLWLRRFDLPDLEAPVIELVTILEQGGGRGLADGLQDAPNADERCLACAMCGCAVDADRATSVLAERFDADTVRQLALPFQAIALVLSQHAARLRAAWQQRPTVDEFGVFDASSC
ncbi:hypothetical protein AY599_21235 [Leptolyngbya valderiana BDU 20041]|nr:hypothetical protein AY599_21235 [Leptolyngbya valderiana BDU 20041]